MTDPAGGTLAATAAIATTTGGMFALGSVMPPGASPVEFLWGCVCAAAGAFSYQFICAQAARQRAADSNVPIANRPTVDIRMVGYAVCGAPMAAACLIYLVHLGGGATGFGNAAFLQSVAGFMVAGAAGPPLVLKIVGAFTAFVGSRTGVK